MQTHLFKSGNSVALRIPQSLWPIKAGTEVEIIREGDHLLIYPIGGSLNELLNVFHGFDKEFMASGRERIIEEDRSW